LRASKATTLGLLLLMAVLTLSHSFMTQLDHGSSPSEVATLPTTSTFNYVVVIAMLNASINNIIGNPLAPYLNYLASTYGLATSYTVVSPHRVPNYLAMTGGSTFGVTTDCTPSTCPISSPNIVDRIEGAGLTWKAWAEDYNVTQGCSSVSKIAGYNIKSFPFLYYTDITSNTSRCNNLLKANTATVSPGPETDNLFLNSLSSTSTAANYNWLSPNDCDSMHSCHPLNTIATADTYLSNLVPAILSSTIFTKQKAALFLTFAEGVQNVVSTTDFVPSIWAGPVAKTGYQSSNQYDHYSMLKTMETSWSLTSLTANDGNAVDMNEFLNTQLGVTATASPNPTEVGTQVKFNAVATGGTAPYTSYAWTFGDGITVTTTTASTTHTYASTGTFTTTVTVTDSVGSTSTSSSMSIAVDKKLNVTASISANPIDAGVSVGLTATSAGGVLPLSCSWSFGDGSTDTGCSTSYAYTTAGAFTATVTATDSLGVTATSSVAVAVDSQLIVTANSSPNPTEVGSQVSFTATATGGTTPYSSYAWTFGDGMTVTTTTASTTHTYTSTGTFTTTVKVTDSAGSKATSSVSVTVNQKLAVTAKANPDPTEVNRFLSLTGTTSGGVGSPTCSWNFGDSTAGVGCSTSHTYTNAGTFTATVTATDSLGVVATGNMTVTVNPKLAVTASASPNPNDEGISISFIATISGGVSPVSCSWTFGDTSSGTGCSTTHTYAGARTFSAKITATDSLSATATSIVSVIVHSKLAVTASASSNLTEVGRLISFAGTTSGGVTPITCSWSFGDGASATGCVSIHTYTTIGSFTAIVTATDSLGVTATSSVTLTINPRLAVTVATTSPNPTEVTKPTNFTSTTSGGVGSPTCSWDFGDGAAAGTCSTSHTYSTAGNFTATVTATDALGVSASASTTVTVKPKLTVTATASPKPTEISKSTSFNATTSGGLGTPSCSWTFGDGSSDTGCLTTHDYTVDGTFNATVTGRDRLGVTSTRSITVTVNPKLTITARASPNPTVGVSVSFTVTPAGGVSPVSCSWDFGDGGKAGACSATHTYQNAGSFSVTVTAVDSLNVNVSSAVSLTVNLAVTISASPSPTEIGVPVTFAAAATGGVSPYAFSWSFDDGTSQVGTVTTHTFTSPKLYGVRLTVMDNNGNRGSTVKQVQVQPALTVTVSSDSAGGTAPTMIHFNATASWGVGPYTFSWSFGDGQRATGPSPAHNYTTPNGYRVQVTVTDAIGITASGSVTITITAQPSSPVTQPPANVATTGPIPVDALVYGIGGAVIILIIVLPIYAVMLRRSRRHPEVSPPSAGC
jgi:PKD repeat protein